jgi:crotonobetainyl-CoA:carnitine CoA-transferase CaiB-like acyl-CoA transferase
MGGPLDGTLVLDLSRVLAGPWASQTLADLGARVIKVERPGRGDDTRSWGPPYLGSGDDRESAYFLCANRGKESIAIDFKDERGRAIVMALAGKADILIDNYKPGGLKAYGLDYDSLSKLNPAIVYCSISGFGQS